MALGDGSATAEVTRAGQIWFRDHLAIPVIKQCRLQMTGFIPSTSKIAIVQSVWELCGMLVLPLRGRPRPARRKNFPTLESPVFMRLLGARVMI